MRVKKSPGSGDNVMQRSSLIPTTWIAVALIALTFGAFSCSEKAPLEPQSADNSTGQQVDDPNVIPGQYIVVLKSTRDIGKQNGLQKRLKADVTRSALKAGVEPIRVYTSVVHGYTAKLTRGQYELLLNDPSVDYIEPDRPVHMIAQTVPWGISAVNAPAVHARGNKGAGVKVGIIDTGIDHTHADLAANYAGGIDFVNGDNDPMDDNGHGSHVSGTVAAVDNSIGVIGVAPSVSLYGIKVLDRFGSGTFGDVVAGIDWAAANGMNVVNMSLGASIGTNALQTACDNAYASGVVICAAAGNDYGGPVSYPAKYSSTIAVSAVDQNNNLAVFSNKGPEVEVAAPGVGIYSTYMGGQYATLDGTSMATPHVAGVCALIWATGQFSAPADVRNQLTATATDIGPAGRDNNFGFGLVNADAATNVGPPPNQPPTANANGPYSALVGANISFSSAGSSDPDGSIVSYSWDFGDGATSTAANPTHAYSAAGTYNVSLTVTDDQGATGSNSTTATITVPTPPVADFSGSPVSGNEPLTVTFTDLSTNNPTSWSWDFGDGATSTAQNPTHTYSAGTYDVTLTATNAYGSNTVTKVAYITANTPPPNQPPTANANGPYSGQAGTAVAFSSAGSSDPDGSIVGYSWDFGDGATSTAANPNHTYANAGTYTVSLTVTDDQGATGSATTTATISSAPPPPPPGEGFILSRNPDFSTDDRNFTTGETMYMKMWSDRVDFTNMSRERWELKDANKNRVRQNFTNNGDGTWTASFALSGLPSNATNWTWKGSLKDNNGTSFKPSTNVVITQGGGGNQPPTANVNGPYSGTVGNAVSFSSAGSSDPDGSIVGYSWDFGDGATSSAANPTHTYSAAGVYTVTLTVTDDQGATGSASTTADITGGATNQPPTANVNGPYSGTVGNAVSFSSAGSSDPDGSIVGYSWDFGDGATSSAANPTHTYSAAGTYTVTLTVTDDQGATGSASTTANITGGGGNVDNVTITKAQYDQQKQKLSVRATTDDPNAVLTVVGYGQMTWNAKKGRWELKLQPVSPGPTTVTVTSTSGGSATSNVTFK